MSLNPFSSVFGTLGVPSGLDTSPCSTGCSTCPTGFTGPDKAIISWNSGANGFSSSVTNGFFGDSLISPINVATIVAPYNAIAKTLTVSLRNNATGDLFTLGANQSVVIVVFRLNDIGLTTPGLQLTLTSGKNTDSTSKNSFKIERGDVLSVAVISSSNLPETTNLVGITASIEVLVK